MDNLLKSFLIIIIFTGFSFTQNKLQGQGLILSGYADMEAYWENPGGSGNSNFYFDNHHFNLIALGEIYGDLFAAAEIEYEHAGEEVSLEYGFLGYTGIKNLRIIAGKFIVPFGRFNKDLHPTWINKMIDRPNGFNNILPQTYNDVGIWLSGAAPLQNGNRFTYDGYVINGLMGLEGGDIRGMRGNDREKFPGGGRDNNKAIGARFGLEFAPAGFDVGTSIYSGNYSESADNNLNLTLLGLDAAYRNHGLEFRGELVHANQNITEGDALKKTGGYLQVAYLIKSHFEPVARFSKRNMPNEDQDQSRFSIGLNYYISSSGAIRVNYHINTEKSGFESNNNAIATQFTTSF